MFKHASVNKVFRLVWSEVRQAWVAVAESVRGRGKRSSTPALLSAERGGELARNGVSPAPTGELDFSASRVVLGSLVAALTMGISGLTLAQVPASNALPTGAAVAAGQATVSTNGARMQVTQSTSSAIVNWSSFNIGSAAQVNFAQPNAASVILNRVEGTDPSLIFGRLTSNGHVFLTNPGGILFAPGAQVDVGGLVASSLSISNADFLAGKFSFSNAGGAGAVENAATISTRSGGFVALIAPQVSNTGSIVAPGGSVGMAAGDVVKLDFDHDGLLSFEVNVAAAAARADNRGQLIADGGRVVMNAEAKNALLSTVLNNDGVVRARSLESRGGEIWLGGGASGVVSVTGTLDASGAAAGQSGGTVKVLGDKVGLSGAASVDASGVGAGGTVLIGGNWQGKGVEQNASATYVGRGVKINADAIDHGNGGKVVVWADDSTRFYGNISARGGAHGGDGGNVEVSGKHTLDFQGLADLRAPNGKTGNLLLDPDEITITHDTAANTTGITCADDVSSSCATPDGTATFLDTTATTGTLTDGTLNAQLAIGNTTVQTTTGDITSNNDVVITGGTSALTLTSGAGINLGGTFTGTALNLNFVTALNLASNPLLTGVTTVTATGDGTSTITGPNVTTNWSLAGASSLTSASGTIGFSGVATLQGGSAVDTFTLGAAATAVIKGGDGVDVLDLASNNLTGSFAGEAAGGSITGIGSAVLTAVGATTGFDGTSANVSVGFTDVGSLTGTGTLTGLNAASAWAMSGMGGTYTSTNALTYNGFATLQGGSAVDTFTLGAASTANIKGGDGVDVLALATNTLTGSFAGEAAGGSITGIGSAVLTAVGTTTGFDGTSANVSAGFTDVGALTGTGTLTGLNAASAWAMSGTGGTYTSTKSLTYNGFATLQGGSAVDTFTLGAAATADIKGGDGVDVLALATNNLTGSFAGEAAGGSITGMGSAVLTAVGATSGFDGTSANVSAGFTDVGALTGTGTLTGLNAASAWAMSGTGGTYTSTKALTYSGFATLQGGSAVDTFTLGAASTANIKGGDAVDVLALATNNLTGSFAGEAAGGSITGMGSAVLTAVGATTGFDGTSANVSAGFTDVGALTGTGTLTGLNAASAWAMSGTGGTYTSTKALTYSGFATLQGGSAVDTFTLGAATTANIKGGDGIDVLALAANTLTGSFAGEAAGGSITGIGSAVLTAVGTTTGFDGTSANVSAGFTDVGALTGTGTLTGLNAASAWAMSGTGGTYTSTNALTYNGFATLQGGSAVDTFTLGAASTANIKGGDGVDVLALATNTLTGSFAGEAAGGSITGIGSAVLTVVGTTTGFDGTSANVSTGFTDVGALAGTGTLTGLNAASTWAMSGTGGTYTSTKTLTYSGFATLQGGSAVDTFTLGAASTAVIKGGDGVDVLALATNNLTGSFAGEAAGGSITGIGSAVLTATGTTTGFNGTSANLSAGFTDVGSLTGTGTLTGINAASAWAVGSTGGTYTSTNSLNYSGFTTLKGGSAVDTFTLASGISFTGSIDGGGGTDELKATDGANTWVSTGSNQGTFNTITSFSNMETLTGGSGNDALSGTGGTYHFTTIDAGTYNGMAWSSVETVSDTGGGTFIGDFGSRLSGPLSGLGATSLSGTITASTIQLTGATTLVAATQLTAPTVTFSNTVNATTKGTEGLIVTGNAIFNSTIGNTKELGALAISGTTTFNAGATSVKTDATANTGNQSYAGTVTLNDNLSLLATGAGTIALNGAVIGNAKNLTINAATAAILGDGTGTDNFTGLSTVDVSGPTTIKSNGITTSGSQRYRGAVTLGLDDINKTKSLTATSVTFDSTVNATTKGTEALSVTGNAVFNNTVGVAKELGAVLVSGTTTFNVGATTVKTDSANTGGQAYSGMVILNEDVSFIATGAGVIAVNGGVTGNGHSLTINAPTTVALGDGVGADSLLGLSSLDVTGSTQIKAQAITTSGTQRYHSVVALGLDDANKTKTLTGTTVTFDSAINASTTGTEALSVVGNSVFNGNVGAVAALGALTVSGTTLFKAGATTINTSTAANTGNQTYTGAVTLNENVAMGANIVTFSNTVDATTKGTESLTITGNAVFNNTVGNTKELGALSVSGTTTFNAGATSVKTDAAANTGNQTYSGLVTLNENLNLLATTAGTIALKGALTGNAHSLTISAPTGVTLGDGIGADNLLGLTTLDVTGPTQIKAQAITTSGTQRYRGSVTLGLDDANKTKTLTGTTVTFDNAINASTTGTEALSVVGNSVFNGNMGAVAALGALTVSGTTLFKAGATTINTSTAANTGNQTYTGAVTLNENVAMGANIVTFSNTVDATTKGTESLAITGNAVFNNTVGNTKELGALSVSGTTTFNAGATSVKTDAAANTGNQTYSGLVTLNENLNLLATTAGTIALKGALTGNAHSLTISAPTGVILGDGIGADNLLGLTTLDVTGPTQIKAQAITTSGTQRYRSGVTLGIDDVNKTKTLTGTTVSFNNTVVATTKGTEALAVTGNAVFDNTVGNLRELGALSVTGTTTFNAGATIVKTDSTTNTGNQTYSGLVTLNENLTLLATGLTGTVALNGGVVGNAHSLAITAPVVQIGDGSGADSLLSLTTLDVTGPTLIKSQAVTTSGTQRYRSPVTLGLDDLNKTKTMTGSTVSFDNTLNATNNGTEALTVTGDAVFGNTVGNVMALGALAVSGATTFNAGATSVNTNATANTGNQTYSGLVTLNENLNLLATGTVGTIALNGALTGNAHSLTISAPTMVKLGDGLGADSLLGLTTLDVADPTQIKAQVITTSGTQRYRSTVALGQDDSNKTKTLTGTTVTFNNTLNATSKGTEALTVTGNAVFNNTVGNATELGALAITGATTFNAGATSVKTDSTANTGNQTYSGLVTLNDNLSLLASTAGTIALNGALTGNAHSLTLSAPTNVLLGDGIGADSLLGLTTVDVTGSTTIKSQAVTSSGTQRYRGAVALGLDDANKTKALTATTVTFDNTVNATSKGTEALAITGKAVLNNNVGNLKELGALAISDTTTFNAGATSVKTDAAANTGNQSYVGAVTGTGLALSSGTGSVTASNAANDFAGTLTLSAKGSSVTDANSLTMVLNDLAASNVISGGALTISGTSETNLKINSASSVSFGATTVNSATGFLDVTAAGNITQTGRLSVNGNIWMLTTVGNIDLGGYQNVNNVINLVNPYVNHIGGTVSLTAPLATVVGGAATQPGSDISLMADRINVGTVRTSNASLSDVGITAARVTLRVQDPNGGPQIAATGAEGLITANQPRDLTRPQLAALTLLANGYIGDPNTPNVTTVGLRVATTGLVVVDAKLSGPNTIMLIGNPALQPVYPDSGKVGFRSVKYNGVEATSEQLTGALDAAYLDIRNQTIEIRESGFAKENANKILRRGVVTTAGPGQPAVDDSTGMAQLDSCDGNFVNGALICQ